MRCPVLCFGTSGWVCRWFLGRQFTEENSVPPDSPVMLISGCLNRDVWALVLSFLNHACRLNMRLVGSLFCDLCGGCTVYLNAQSSKNKIKFLPPNVKSIRITENFNWLSPIVHTVAQYSLRVSSLFIDAPTPVLYRTLRLFNLETLTALGIVCRDEAFTEFPFCKGVTDLEIHFLCPLVKPDALLRASVCLSELRTLTLVCFHDVTVNLLGSSVTFERFTRLTTLDLQFPCVDLPTQTVLHFSLGLQCLRTLTVVKMNLGFTEMNATSLRSITSAIATLPLVNHVNLNLDGNRLVGITANHGLHLLMTGHIATVVVTLWLANVTSSGLCGIVPRKRQNGIIPVRVSLNLLGNIIKPADLMCFLQTFPAQTLQIAESTLSATDKADLTRAAVAGTVRFKQKF